MILNNIQQAPYPGELKDLVENCHYKESEGWKIRLAHDLVRDPPKDGTGGSYGLTLVITRAGPDSYHPESYIYVNHYFPVIPATYDYRSWRRWLLERFMDVERHEAMENFIIGDERPYAPSHGPGNDPYLVREVGTLEDQRTSFLGVLKQDG